jgi:hypothetical protein
MMQTLNDLDRDMLEQAYQDERWVYATRSAGDLFALGMVVLGRRSMIEIPTSCCWSESFNEMRSYVKFLNEERCARQDAEARDVVEEHITLTAQPLDDEEAA